MRLESLKQFIEVFGGEFCCDSCGARWVGTWHGAKKDITCIVCGKLMYEDEDEES